MNREEFYNKYNLLIIEWAFWNQEENKNKDFKIPWYDFFSDVEDKIENPCTMTFGYKGSNGELKQIAFRIKFKD